MVRERWYTVWSPLHYQNGQKEVTLSGHLVRVVNGEIVVAPTEADGRFEVLERQVQHQVILGVPGHSSLDVDGGRTSLHQSGVHVASEGAQKMEDSHLNLLVRTLRSLYRKVEYIRKKIGNNNYDDWLVEIVKFWQNSQILESMV